MYVCVGEGVPCAWMRNRVCSILCGRRVRGSSSAYVDLTNPVNNKHSHMHAVLGVKLFVGY